MVFFMGDSPVEPFVNFPVPGVNAAITDHFVMLFWDMADKALYKFHNWDRFFHIPVILVAVVMESDKIPIILIDPGSGNHGAPKVAANVFDGCFWVTFAGLGIYVEPFFVLPVAAGLYFFKGRANSGFHFIKQGSAEGIAQEGIVKIIDVAPESVVAVTSFRNKAVDMRVPF